MDSPFTLTGSSHRVSAPFNFSFEKLTWLRIGLFNILEKNFPEFENLQKFAQNLSPLCLPFHHAPSNIIYIFNLFRCISLRRHPDLNWGIEDLQSTALPLGDTAIIPNGAQSQTRTGDTRIFSPLLYQLSYLGKINVYFYFIKKNKK